MLSSWQWGFRIHYNIVICRNWFSLCQWVDESVSFQNLLTTLLQKNRTASDPAVAVLLGRLQSCGPCVFWFILTLLLSELQCSLLGYQGVSPTSMQILALRKLKAWVLIGVLEAIFSTTTMKGLCSIHGMERITPSLHICLSPLGNNQQSSREEDL